MKHVCILHFSGPHFLTFGMNTRFSLQMSVSSLNVGKDGPENSEHGHLIHSVQDAGARCRIFDDSVNAHLHSSTVPHLETDLYYLQKCHAFL